VRIAVIGNGRKSEEEIYTRVPGAIEASANQLGLDVELTFITTSNLVVPENLLREIDGIFALPTPFEDLIGFYNSLMYARNNDIPWLGVCGATQHAWVEFGVNECGINDGYHREQRLESGTLMVDYLPDHYRVVNDGPLFNFNIKLTGDYNELIEYDTSEHVEPFFANFTIRSEFIEPLEKAGLITIGTFDDNETPCLFELKNHPFFIGALFQPQMAATMKHPHPLISGLLKASQ
jgi:CTP synthase (UTP-ammonia lyase)